MNIIKLLAFKNESRVDWKQVSDNISIWVEAKDHNNRASAKAMWAADIEKELRQFVHNVGVKAAYYTWATITGKDEVKNV